MPNTLIDCVLHWRRKLEKDPTDDYMHNVLRKLSEVPMTLKILEATHIGKTIRKLTKRDDLVGEKAMTILKKWREAFTASYRVENIKDNKSSNNSTSNKKSFHSQKEISQNNVGNNSVSPSLSKQSSNKYVNENCKMNISTESSHSLYKNNVKEGNSKYLDYDPCTEASTSYNPECPEFFPSDKPVKSKKPDFIETYDPSCIKHETYDPSLPVKRKATDEKQLKEAQSLHKKFKSSSDSNSLKVFNTGESKRSPEKKDNYKVKAKDPSHSSSLKKESSKLKLHNESSKKHGLASDTKKTKSKEPSENDGMKSKKAKAMIQSKEEFTSSEVSFEDCLGFNDVVTHKKISKSHSSKKQSSGNTPSKKKFIKESKKDPQKSALPERNLTFSKESCSYNSKEKASEYSSFTNSNKSKISKYSHDSHEAVLFTVPKPSLKLDIAEITSTLLENQSNYRLLQQSSEIYSSKKKEVISNEDTIKFTTSRREKTAVYSGRKNANYYTEVPSLFKICTKVLIENIDAIECVGDATFEMMKPVLERCTPSQLYIIENYNPAFIEDTNDLWEVHCKRDFKLVTPMEHETWRELYWRAHDEREIKLESVKKNISKTISTSTPVRQIKLAYIDSSYIKPPRDVARKQDKYGTAAAVNHPIKSSLTSKPDPKPCVPAVSTSSSRSNSLSNVVKQKPIIAPLMKKTLQSMKALRRK